MIKIKSAEFITSAVKKNQYPQTGFPEVSFVGRSNVGKSTIINALTNRRKLAKVSNTPGRTRLVNFFLINLLGSPTTIFFMSKSKIDPIIARLLYRK